MNNSNNLKDKKLTKWGLLILELISTSSSFLSAQDIYLKLREQSYPVGLATVYRQLQVLLEKELIDSIKNNSGEIMYKQCRATNHHHHIICLICGNSEEIFAPEIETWAASEAQRLGYSELSHTLEIFGHCQKCRNT